MKISTSKFLPLLFLILCVCQLKAQDKLLIEDKANVIDLETEALIAEKLKTKGISLTSTVDFRMKCEYYFVTIDRNETEVFAEIKNCKDETIGYKPLGSALNELETQEKAIIIYYAIWESIETPVKRELPQASFPEEGKYYEKEKYYGQAIYSDSTEHDSRYFFAPSALPLKRGEFYYNTVYFLLHDLQFGVTDRFTLGLGTTIIGFPVYATAKYSIPISEKSTLAFGDLAIIGTFGADFRANLFYSTYTYGTGRRNISLGGGLLSMNDSDFADRSNNLVGNISGLLGLGNYFFLLTENYVFQVDNTQTAFQNNQNFSRRAEFVQTNTLWYGVTGFRFVRKRNELTSWQVGITHFLRIPGAIPSAYDNSSWNIPGNEESSFVAFPTISYTRKFRLD